MVNTFRRNRKWWLLFGILALVFVLSACTSRAVQDPIGPNSEGLWEGVILWNFSRAIIWVSELFGGNYGIGIIVITIIFRVLMLPLTIYQNKNMAKMNAIQPEMKELQEKYSGEELQEKQSALYEEAGVNPLMGCLPVLVQMPIFIAVYQAVSRTPALANESFLWVNLGEPDPYFILPILAGLFTFVQSYLMQMNKPGNTGLVMSFTMPLLIIFITAPLSSGLALYFVASNAFAVVQTLIFQNPFKERKEQKELERQEQEKEERARKARKKAKKLGRNVKK